MFELMDAYSQSAVIKVIGVGGGGGNAVKHMANCGIEGVDAGQDLHVVVLHGISLAVVERGREIRAARRAFHQDAARLGNIEHAVVTIEDENSS